MWGPKPVESKIKCLVSTGTGIPSLKPFRDDVLYVGITLFVNRDRTDGRKISMR